MFLKIALVLALVCLGRGQDLDVSNEDSQVLLTLTQPSDKDKVEEKPSEDSPILLNFKEEGQSGDDLTKNVISDKPAVIVHPDPFSPFPSASPAGPAPSRPSLLQAFLAGRGGATTTRPNPVLDLVKNLNVTGRAGVLRERIGRFRIPRLETNEQSFAYRAGRRVGLFFQNISKRARVLAERLRARAATATPTAS